MRFLASLSAAFLLATQLGGCAVIKSAETAPLKCGEAKDVIYEIPTTQKPVPVNVQFKMSCEAEKKGVELSIKNHPWGGVGMTMPRTLGKQAPDYEYIPCENGPELMAKWNEFESYAYFADKGRDIDNTNNVRIDQRFSQDYAFRHYVLNSVKNFCSAVPK